MPTVRGMRTIALVSGLFVAGLVVACSSSDSGGSSSSSSSSSGSSGTSTDTNPTNPGSSGSGGTTSSSSSSGDPADASSDVADKDAACGSPGDNGNDKGVGKYCKSLVDCIGNNEAMLCATAGDPNATFCTKLCSMGDGTSVCGSDAQCVCDPDGSQCGCTPTKCL